MNTNNKTTGAHHNPLDRNHDGKVNLQDLKPNAGLHNTGLNNQNLGANQVLAPGMTSTTTTTTTQSGLVGPNTGLNNAGFNTTGLNNSGLNNSGLNNAGLNNAGLNNNLGMNTTTTEVLGAGQGAYLQSNRRASVTRAEPTVMEVIQKDVVVHEHIHPVQKEEIQPIIYREREQLDVKQVTQMMHETQIQPTVVQQRQLPAERREAVVERGAPIAENFHASSREVDSTLRSQVVHAPIINEVIKKTVIEEIQPVLERDIITSTVIQNTQPIYEKYVDAPQVYRETVTVVDRGIVGGDLEALRAQGFNLGEVGRRLSQTYTQEQLTGQQGFSHQGLAAGQPGYNTGLNNTGFNNSGLNNTGLNNTGLNNAGLNNAGLNNSGLSNTGLNNTGLNNTGVTGAHHHNPLDRNHDGKVNLQDLTGRQTSQPTTNTVNTL